MKTIKLPYKTDQDLTTLLKQYSSVVRYSYNRFIEGRTEKEIREFTKLLNNIDLLNSWLIRCGIKDAKAIYLRFKDQKVVFGGKSNFIKRIKNKITKEDYCIKRLLPLNVQGEELKQGNRLFKLDIIENNQVIFKLNKSTHINLKLPNLRNNIKKDIFKLQQLNEVKHGDKGYTYSIKLDLDYIYITFEEFKTDKPVLLNENRCLSIDLNPNNIGISVIEKDKDLIKVIHAQEFSLKSIFDKILSQKLSSDSYKMKYFQNKLKFETFEISKSIANLAKHYRCKYVFVEDLKFKDVDSGLGKTFNRKTKNLWKRELLMNNLTKRLNIEGIKFYTVNPIYSSFIGNMQYQYTDAVNTSIDIARRGYKCIINKNKKAFFPNLLVKHQWKEMVTKFKDWKEFFLAVKNLKLRYRVSLDEVKTGFRVFQQNSNHKSMVFNYTFYG